MDCYRARTLRLEFGLAAALQIQNIGVGHAAVVNLARCHGATPIVRGAACSSDVHAPFSGSLARAPLLVCSHKRGSPFIQDALGDSRQRLPCAAGDQRDYCALVIRIE